VRPTVLADRPDGYDPRVREARRRVRLPAEALEVVLRVPRGTEGLEGDAAIEGALDGLVDDAHGAAAELADDLEVPDDLPRAFHGAA